MLSLTFFFDMGLKIEAQSESNDTLTSLERQQFSRLTALDDDTVSTTRNDSSLPQIPQ